MLDSLCARTRQLGQHGLLIMGLLAKATWGLETGAGSEFVYKLLEEAEAVLFKQQQYSLLPTLRLPHAAALEFYGIHSKAYFECSSLIKLKSTDI